MASSYCTGQHSSRLTLSCLRQSLPRGIRCTMKKKKKKKMHHGGYRRHCETHEKQSTGDG